MLKGDNQLFSEDLNVKGMMKNKKLAKHTPRCKLGSFCTFNSV